MKKLFFFSLLFWFSSCVTHDYATTIYFEQIYSSGRKELANITIKTLDSLEYIICYQESTRQTPEGHYEIRSSIHERDWETCYRFHSNIIKIIPYRVSSVKIK